MATISSASVTSTPTGQTPHGGGCQNSLLSDGQTLLGGGDPNRQTSLDEGDNSILHVEDNSAKYDLMDLGDKGANAWELEAPLAEFFNKHATKFIESKVIKEAITDERPVPSNIIKKTKLDEFVTTLLRTNPNVQEQNKIISRDVELGEIWDKVAATMGPLGKMWQNVENYKAGRGSDDVPLEDLTDDLQKAIVLMGQAANQITYSRRVNVLTHMTGTADRPGAVSRIKEKREVLEEETTCLLGGTFSEELVKSKKVLAKG